MTLARRVGIGFGLILALGAVGMMCQRVGARGRFAVSYSTYGAGPQGARALSALIGEQGLAVGRWSEDLAGLPADATLVALGGCESRMARQVSRYERDSLESWLEAGGVLIVAGAHEYLWEDLGITMVQKRADCDPIVSIVGELVRAERDGPAPSRDDGGPGDDLGAEGGDQDPNDDKPNDEDPYDYGDPYDDLGQAFEDDPLGTLAEVAEEDALPKAEWATATHSTLAGLGGIDMRQPARLAIHEGQDHEVLLSLPEGPAAVVVPHGRGRIIALASASMLQNRELDSADGGVLFVRLLRAYGGRGTVLFDEYHLGTGERRSFMRYVRQLGGTAFVLQLILVALLLLWRRGARFGAPHQPPTAPPPGTASYVGGIGALYGKSKDAAGALAIMARRALLRVAQHHHLPPQESEQMARELEARSQNRAAKTVRSLAWMATQPSPANLLTSARQIDELVALATTEVPTESRNDRDAIPPRGAGSAGSRRAGPSPPSGPR